MALNDIKDNSKRINSLTKYVEDLKRRLGGPVPLRHESRSNAWKQMLEIDIRKTLCTIDKLK